MSASNAPPAGDPKRSAASPLSGFEYQLWLSVYEWTRLNDEELLYLECIEDLDKLAGPGVESIQVKKEQKPLSLSTKRARTALEHYLATVERNPGRSIRYRYHTTAAAGRERGNPFGGRPCIAVWNACASDSLCDTVEADIRKLQAVLRRNTSSAYPMLQRALSKSPSDFHETIVTRFRWATNASSLEEVFELLHERLVLDGHPLGIPASEAQRVAPHLFRTAIEHAIERPLKPLKRADYLRLLEQRTSISVPRGALVQGAPSNLVPAPSLTSGDKPVALVGTDIWSAPPPLSATVQPRRDLVASIVEMVARAPLVFLGGSTGVGKTTLAALVVARLALPCVWIDVRTSSDTLRAVLRRALVAILAQEQEPCVVVLDDLPSGMRLKEAEPVLARLMHALRLGGGRLLATVATNSLPARLVSGAFRDAVLSTVPAFTHDEIRSFLDDMRCPRGIAANWAQTLEVQTGGHPQLVAACVHSLAGKCFPAPDVSDVLSTPAPIEDAREEARLLMAQSLSQDARNLLYRLSVWIGHFERADALELCTASRPIARPGEAFDEILGGWLERRTDTYFATSPLAVAAASKTYPAEQLTQIHRDICDVVLKRSMLSQVEIRTLAFHSIAAQYDTGLHALAAGFFSATEDTRKALAESISWLCAIGVGETNGPYRNPQSRATFRFLQFNIALRTEAGVSPELLEAIEEDLADATLPPVLYTKYSFLCLRLTQPGLAVEATALLTYIGELNSLYGQIERDAMKGPSPDHAVRAFLFGRYHSIANLEAIVGVLTSDDETARATMREAAKDEEECRALLGFAWLHEGQSEKPDYEHALSVLVGTAEIAGVVGMLPLARSAARLAALTLDENLGRPDEGHALLCDAGQKLGWSPAMTDQLAWIEFRKRGYKTALGRWRDCLENWMAADAAPAYSARAAAIAAFHSSSWQEATALFDRAATLAEKNEVGWLQAGLLTDAGALLWQHEEPDRAIERFGAAIRIILDFPASSDTLHQLFVKRAFGATIAYCRAQPEASRPPVGFASTPEPSPAIRDEVDPPIDFVQVQYAQLLRSHAPDDPLGEEITERACLSPYPTARFLGFTLALASRVASAEMAELGAMARGLALAASAARETDDVMAQLDRPARSWPDFDEAIRNIFASGAICTVAKGSSLAEQVREWLLQVSTDQLLETTCGWLHSIHKLLCDAETDWRSIVVDSSSARCDRIIASAALVAADEGTPDDRFYAHALIALFAAESTPYEVELFGHVAKLVRRDWSCLIKRPHLLRAPALVVSEVAEVCAKADDNPKKAVAKVLRAAEGGVRVRIPQTMRDTLGLV